MDPERPITKAEVAEEHSNLKAKLTPSDRAWVVQAGRTVERHRASLARAAAERLVRQRFSKAPRMSRGQSKRGRDLADALSEAGSSEEQVLELTFLVLAEAATIVEGRRERAAVRLRGLDAMKTRDHANVRNKRQEYQTAFENFDQKANQLFNILSTVLKNKKDMEAGVTRNML